MSAVTIAKGTVFDTDFEVGCVAQEAPNERGSFDGRDCDGAEVRFSTVMVLGHPDHREPFHKPEPADRLGVQHEEQS